MKFKKKSINKILDYIIFTLLLLITFHVFKVEPFNIGGQVQNSVTSTLDGLYRNHLKQDFNIIFPSSNRNGGGAHFFKYAYDKFKNQHTTKYSTPRFNSTQFENFHKIYCAVSGSPIKPQVDNTSTSDLKLKKLSKVGTADIDLTDDDFIIGKYYRCCTPCICDLMKHSVVTDNKIEITNDDNESVSLHLILIKNPCNNPDKLPKNDDGTPKAPAFQCVDGRVDQSRVIYLDELITDSDELNIDYSNYLVIGVLYDHHNSSEYNLQSDMTEFSCQRRFTSNDPPGGMGEIFIKLSLAGLGSDEEYLGYIPSDIFLNR